MSARDSSSDCPLVPLRSVVHNPRFSHGVQKRTPEIWLLYKLKESTLVKRMCLVSDVILKFSVPTLIDATHRSEVPVMKNDINMTVIGENVPFALNYIAHVGWVLS